MDEAFGAYLTGMAGLRERVVENLKRKLKDGGVLDDPPDRSTPRSARTRRRR